MRIFVTGARGFIGRHFVAEATRRGDAVVSAPAGSRPEELRRLVMEAAPEAIVHLAFVPAAGESDSERALRVNLDLQRALLEGAPEASTLIIAGSAAEYGAVVGPTRIDEAAALRPQSAYGRIKRELERQALEQQRRVVWLRIFNVVGPGQPTGHPVADWVARIAQLEQAGGGRLQTGDLRPVRDFVDVRDVATGLRAACEIEAQPVVANLASGIAVCLRDLAEMACALATVPIEVAESRSAGATAVPRAVGDPTRFRELTGWRPSRDLRLTVEESLAVARAELQRTVTA